MDTPAEHGLRFGRDRRRELHVHGWVFMIETGEVLSYDATSKQFIPFELAERS